VERRCKCGHLESIHHECCWGVRCTCKEFREMVVVCPICGLAGDEKWFFGHDDGPTVVEAK